MEEFIRIDSPQTNVVLDSRAILTEGLSLPAIGLYAWLIANLDTGKEIEINSKELSKKLPCGRDAIRGILREMEAHGLTVLQAKKDSSGRNKGREWVVFRTPNHRKPESQAFGAEKPKDRKPDFQAFGGGTPYKENYNSNLISPVVVPPTGGESQVGSSEGDNAELLRASNLVRNVEGISETIKVPPSPPAPTKHLVVTKDLVDNTPPVESPIETRVTEVIEAFRETTGRTRVNPAVKSNRKKIRQRLNEGHPVHLLIAMIYCKYDEWNKDDYMKKYLELDTIFAETHFGKYSTHAEERGYYDSATGTLTRYPKSGPDPSPGKLSMVY